MHQQMACFPARLDIEKNRAIFSKCGFLLSNIDNEHVTHTANIRNDIHTTSYYYQKHDGSIFFTDLSTTAMFPACVHMFFFQ